jgi:long-subunit acyl-CoA synthetase (AMP-forming)
VNDSGSEIIFVSPENLAGFRKALSDVKRPFEDSRIVLLCKPEDKPKGSEGLQCVYEIMGTPALEPEHFDGLESQQTAWLCYSSGTTGLPKGVMTMHCNLTTQLVTSVPLYPAMEQGRDAILGFLPMSHVYGLIALLLYPLSSGVPVVVLPRFDELAAYKAIEKVRLLHTRQPPDISVQGHNVVLCAPDRSPDGPFPQCHQVRPLVAQVCQLRRRATWS